MMDEAFGGRRVLITGGLGFIGSNLAHRLVGLGADVALVDNMTPTHGGNRFNIHGIEDRVDVHIGDLRDGDRIRGLVSGRDYIFNLAGQSAHFDSMEDPFNDLALNCTAQLSLLEACRAENREARIVFASTRQVYGRPDYLPVDERHALRPVDVNGIHKLAGEQYHLLYRDVYGIRSCALRLTNTIGPRMRVKDARQTFLGIWVREVVRGEPFEVWGGEQLRDFNFVDDVVDAMLMAALAGASDGQLFNLGGPEVVSLRELADLLVEVNGCGSYEVRPYPADRKVIDIGDYYGDSSLASATLGWQARTELRTALSVTLDYYRQHLERYR
jgi:UDP-glucose 4-epimerase